MKKTAILGILTVLALAASAQAALLNPSFELPQLAVNADSTAVPADWKRVNNGHIMNGTDVYNSGYAAVLAENGNQAADVGGGRLWQNTGIALVNGDTYTLTFDASRYSGGLSGSLLAANTNGASDYGTSFAYLAWAPTTKPWCSYSVEATYTGPSGKYLTISLDSTSWMAFDDVQLSIIPEPGAMAVLALGGIGMIIRRRRRA